ncbi:MAG: hypothetical protein V2I54_03295 [Bacteroidales bacterium]|jgi:hypothetical protein|nr:hypothetical protein [Bacteroidales bacterium]
MIQLLLISQHRISISIEFIMIVLLFIYIIYLHLRLSRKSFLIKYYIEKQGIPEDRIEKKDILQLLEKLRNPDRKETLLKDKMLDRQFSHFLFEEYDKIKLFLHYTSKRNIAENILREGFKFVNSFYKTAENIHNDELFLIHRHHEHKQYGHYVIVICISKELYNTYSKKLSNLKAKNIAVEQILTETKPYSDENADEVYILPKQFIKGYFNYMEGTIVKNPAYDYNYQSPRFKENIREIEQKNPN